MADFHGPIAGPTGCTGLTDLGRTQARLLHDHLESTGRITVDHVVTSLIPRAIETAEIVAPALGFADVDQDCSLCEVHTGDADGVDWADYPKVFGSFDMLAEPDRPFAPNGDSWNGFHERVGHAMDRLSNEHVGRTVMAVCHARGHRGIATSPLRCGRRPRCGPPGSDEHRPHGMGTRSRHLDVDPSVVQRFAPPRLTRAAPATRISAHRSHTGADAVAWIAAHRGTHGHGERRRVHGAECSRRRRTG